jgi:hypothetical protein
VKVNCARCNEQVDIDELPKPQIMNTPGVSVLVIEHPKGGFCLGCRAPLRVALQGAELRMIGVPIVPEKKDPAIVAPAKGK